MQRNELYTQCEKLAASINLSEFIDPLVMETINSGILATANHNGTSYRLPQWIVYKALTQYTECLKTSIPQQLQTQQLNLTSMHNKISVLFNDKLFFATDRKSVASVNDLIKVFNVLNRKFPNEEGYTIEVQYYIMTFTRENWRALMDFRNKIRSFLSE